MKTIQHLFKGITIFLFLLSTTIYSQEYQPLYVSVTTSHWNMDLENFSMEEWKNGAMEYHNKVVMKNEHILSASTLLHRFTMDNTEVINVTVYASWDAIEDASKRNNELTEAAWPDANAREAFFKNQSKFFTNDHSDEIYQTIPGAKNLVEIDLPMLYYVRTRHFSFPEDGSNEEFMSLLDEYNQAVTHKNEFYKAYFPQVHFYGSDRTEFVEAILTSTLADLEKGLVRQGEIFRSHWADEKARNEFNKKFEKYFTGKHGDRIYSSVPELYKSASRAQE